MSYKFCVCLFSNWHKINTQMPTVFYQSGSPKVLSFFFCQYFKQYSLIQLFSNMHQLYIYPWELVSVLTRHSWMLLCDSSSGLIDSIGVRRIQEQSLRTETSECWWSCCNLLNMAVQKCKKVGLISSISESLLLQVNQSRD